MQSKTITLHYLQQQLMIRVLVIDYMRNRQVVHAVVHIHAPGFIRTEDAEFFTGDAGLDRVSKQLRCRDFIPPRTAFFADDVLCINTRIAFNRRNPVLIIWEKKSMHILVVFRQCSIALLIMYCLLQKSSRCRYFMCQLARNVCKRRKYSVLLLVVFLSVQDTRPHYLLCDIMASEKHN